MSIAVSRPFLGPADAGIRLSRDAFAVAEYQEPYIYERVMGRLVVMSPAGPEHRLVSRPFRRQLSGYWDRHPDLVDDVDVEGWVATSEVDDRLPDICVYLKGASSHETVPVRVPELVFEFVSSSRSDQERDYVQKRREYHGIGVQEYVIVDRLKRQVLVLRWQKTDFDETVLSDNEIYTTPLLPGLEIAIGAAFAI